MFYTHVHRNIMKSKECSHVHGVFCCGVLCAYVCFTFVNDICKCCMTCVFICFVFL